MIFRVAADMGSALNQALAGDADVVNLYGTPEMVQRVRQTPGPRLDPYAPNAYPYIGLNFRDPRNAHRPHPLFGDRAPTRAIPLPPDSAPGAPRTHGYTVAVCARAPSTQ